MLLSEIQYNPFVLLLAPFAGLRRSVVPPSLACPATVARYLPSLLGRLGGAAHGKAQMANQLTGEEAPTENQY